MDWVAGVDGCPDGWVVALEDLDSGAVSSAACETFAQILELPQQPRVIAVDVPIGLLSQAQVGGRACDKEARRILGPRGSSVFSAPTRPALEALEAGLPYEAVSEANRRSSPAQLGLSKQSFAIMPKIAEVDRVVTPQLQERVFEIHPEVSFSRAKGGAVLPPKKRSAGRAAREDILRRLGYVETLEWFPKPGSFARGRTTSSTRLSLAGPLGASRRSRRSASQGSLRWMTVVSGWRSGVDARRSGGFNLKAVGGQVYHAPMRNLPRVGNVT